MGIVLFVLAVGGAVAMSMSGGRPGQTAGGNPSVEPSGVVPPTTRPSRTNTPPTTTRTPATPEPPADTGIFAPGETVTVTADDEPYLDIVVSKVREVAKYDGDYNIDDVPEVKGNVFIELYVTYASLQDGASYNQFDWSVFVDDRAVDTFTYVSNGPVPDLGSGDLPKGRKAEGWLIYEVPKTGRVVLSYGGSFLNDAPVFEVVLRAD